MKGWKLHDAKARFIEVVRSWKTGEPQDLSDNDEPADALISRADYDRLKLTRSSFVEFLRRSPMSGTEIEVERDRSPARDVRL